ncbi:MAG: exonuclease SbcCD subunit D C-terminal domain-containing protein [Syntrophomonas sp.]
MRIIHSSDWHLGRSLYGRKRYEEHESFFNWLLELLDTENIDVLLVAGDIFDNTAPSNRAQELYYRFLCRVAESSCRHVVITAGNHDSPSFLCAPRDLLRHLHIHIVGAGESIDDEILVLKDPRGDVELIVCAVPYLRERDIRSVEAGESIEDKEKKVLEGIHRHYMQVFRRAEQLQAQLQKHVPIVAMGHLFAAGGLKVEGDGVRDLYVGTLAQVGADIFPATIDYAALGHLHSAQMVGGNEKCRYSGSPLPMSFLEANREKMVMKAVFSEGNVEVIPIAVPTFKALHTIRGNWERIQAQVAKLKSLGIKAWLEIVYEGDEIIANLRERLDEAVAASELEISRVGNLKAVERSLAGEGEMLGELDVNEVFGRCLDAYEIASNQREDLLAAYREVINALDTEDLLAE